MSPRAVAEMRPWVQRVVDTLLDNIAARETFDLVEDYAAAIPVEVIGSLLRIRKMSVAHCAWSLAILGALEFELTDERRAEGNRW